MCLVLSAAYIERCVCLLLQDLLQSCSRGGEEAKGIKLSKRLPTLVEKHTLANFLPYIKEFALSKHTLANFLPCKRICSVGEDFVL